MGQDPLDQNAMHHERLQEEGELGRIVPLMDQASELSIMLVEDWG